LAINQQNNLNHGHRIDKHLDILLAIQTAQKVLPMTTVKSSNCKNGEQLNQQADAAAGGTVASCEQPEAEAVPSTCASVALIC